MRTASWRQLSMHLTVVTVRPVRVMSPTANGVNWFVLAEPAQASAAQIGKFSQIMGENARPIQLVNNLLLIKKN